MKKVTLLGCLLFISQHFFAQAFNGDPAKSFINISIPKTPEAQGIEKYGNTQVNENTGSPNISVPLYNVKSRFLEVPVSLSYSASGIRVDQEATWTGLGFDLIAGGRITVEIKGSLDNNSRWNIMSEGTFKPQFQRIINRLGNYYPRTILTYASVPGLCNGGTVDCSTIDTMWDHTKAVETMAWYGVGEPDIFHANFMGQSVSFYYDMMTDQVKWLGEKSLFDVTNSKDNFGIVTNWTIRDNSGIAYYFNQPEKTLMSSIPNGMGISQFETNTSWLLTKIVHPSGDSVNFSYANYGKTYPATTPSASVNTTESPNVPGINLSPDNPRDASEQNPYYLTKIETQNVVLDFILTTRDDLKGAGARKLSEIRVSDKITSEVKKKMRFGYGYFSGTLESFHTSQPDSVTKYYKQRLRLDSLYTDDPALTAPYLFYYYNQVGVSIPEKYSYSQDHWGYYNGRLNNSGSLAAGSPSNLIPTKYSLSLEGIPVGFSNSIDGFGDRRASAAHMPVMTMDSIIYPTGGSTKLFYEPHQTDYFGGGLRVKKTIDYSNTGVVAGTTEYTYEEGYYSGVLNYTKIVMEHVPGGCGQTAPPYPYFQYRRLSINSSGAISYGGALIGYAKVTKIQKTPADAAGNGKVVKYFKAAFKTGFDCGIEKRQAHYPNGYFCLLGVCNTFNNHADWLYENNSQLQGTLSEKWDGKPTKEEYYDNNNTLVKSTEYFYSRANYSDALYSIKCFDGFANGPSVGTYNSEYPSGSGIPMCPYNHSNGYRRYILVATPAKSYNTLTDSIIEKTYNGSSFVRVKKAFNYNSYAQPEFVSSYNSDGTQTISYTKTPLSFVRPQIPSAGENDAYKIEQLKSAHIYEVPIEQVTINRTTAGDSLVTAGMYNVYEGAAQKKVFMLETQAPLVFRSQFIPTYYYHNYPTLPSFNVVKDSRYKLQDSAIHYPGELIKDIYSKAGVKGFIWDETYNILLAQGINATGNDIAFSSFETAAKGGWTYSGSPVADATAITGAKAYLLSNGSISKTGLGTSLTYFVSYWSRNGQQTVSGGSAVTTGRTYNGYTLYQHKVVNPSAGTITVSGTGTIDELKLYPELSLLTTYTYKPLIGINSQSDVNDRIAYYEYDNLNRLTLIRDQDKKIIKKIDYKYQTCPSAYTNAIQSNVFYKNSCGYGYVSSPVTYTVATGQYSSCVSQAYADSVALADVNANGQAYANANATCSACTGDYSAAGGWTKFYHSVTPNSNTVSITIAIAATSSSSFDNILSGVIVGSLTNTCCRPSVARSFTCFESGRVWNMTIYPNGNVLLVRTGGAALPGVNYGFTLSGSYNL